MPARRAVGVRAMQIDINCDIGEEGREGSEITPAEEALLEAVTSVNIACGFHAGSPGIMGSLCRAASQRGIAIGAHPSLPDREGFGRREIPLPPREIHDIVLYQIGALGGFAAVAGVKLAHIKPHGALYHMAEKDGAVAQAIIEAAEGYDSSLVIVGLAGGNLVKIAREGGLRAANEVFADRAYLAEGSLAPRGTAGAVIIDPDVAAQRIVRLLTTGEIAAQDGTPLHLPADTVCIHSDSPGSGEAARRLRERLAQARIEIAPLGSR